MSAIIHKVNPVAAAFAKDQVVAAFNARNIERAADGLPLLTRNDLINILSIVEIESRFDPTANSWADAKGLMQINRTTWNDANTVPM